MAAATPSKITGDLAQTMITIPLVGGGAGTAEKVVSLGEFEITKKQKMVEATDTDSGGSEQTLPSTFSWTATGKYMYVDGDVSQQQALLDALNTQNTPGLVPPTWAFYVTKATGRDMYTGQAWVETLKVTTGVGKLVATDITLRGQGYLVRSQQP